MKEEEKKEFSFNITDKRIKIDEEIKEEPTPAPKPETKAPPPPQPPQQQTQNRQAQERKAQSKKTGAITLEQFIISLGHSALMHLGEIPNPADGKKYLDMEGAQQTIDMLSMLEEKTRGNLSPQEESLFKNLLSDLRLRFIEKKPKSV